MLLKVQCCYCDAEIVDHGRGVWIAIEAMAPHGSTQQMCAHIECLGRHFGPALSPSVPFDAEAFGPD